MAVDLTRFDFNAKNFTHSDNVRAMTLEEIGQYVLLLCEAWLTDKEATLPDDIDALTNMCRGKKPSKKVLEMFPVVPELGRRRNQRLYGEWVLAKKRSDDGRKAVETRWDKQGVTEEIQPTHGRNTVVFPAVLPKPSQVEPIQTNSNQSVGTATFKYLAVRYSRDFGINHSHARKHIEKYQTACSKYGEDKVLEYFDQWSPAQAWLKERRDSNGLNFFFSKALDDLAEGDQMRRDRDEAVQAAAKIAEKQDKYSIEAGERNAEKIRQQRNEESEKAEAAAAAVTNDPGF